LIYLNVPKDKAKKLASFYKEGFYDFKLNDKGYIQIVPFLGGSTAGTPLPAAVMSEGIFAKIWVRYTAGYDVPPVSIKAATALFANRYIGLQENPVGAKSVRFGRNFQLEWDSEHDPVYLRIQQLLNPYINYVFRRP
jgi:hypothetical protein